jgi:uncharacterized protein YodC (DUF2158 family)
MAEFKIGDLVKLKSGGPVMTVDTLSHDGKVYCVWYQHDGYLGREFQAETLERYDPEDLS